MSRPLLPLAILGALLLGGCATEGGARPKPVVVPWPEAGAPSRLLGLSGDLMAFQGASGHLPMTLAQLDRAGLSTAGPYATTGIAYHPAGLGVLTDDWRVLAVDDREIGEKVWCVVVAPARRNDAPGVRTVLVPMRDLRAAAVATDTAP